MTLSEEIRAAYPEPVMPPSTAPALLDMFRPREGPQAYCVGGAVCLFVGWSNTFPTPGILKWAMLSLNPALAQMRDQALYTACDAVLLGNDVGDFAAAWCEVDRLLEWMP